jgi:hypothetical protein
MDAASLDAGWEGHLKMHITGGVGRITYCELRHMGQKGVLGYVSGSGRNSGFRFQNRSVPDIFTGSWFPVTVMLLILRRN